MPDNNVEGLGYTPNGAHLFREPNGVGGHIYYSDEIGGGTTVWDTSLVDEGTLLSAMVCERRRKYLERQLEIERIAATGGSFLSQAVKDELQSRREQESVDEG